MDIHACHCSWDIPGVDALPDHHHYMHPVDTGVEVNRAYPGRTEWAMEERVAIWVDWYEVARELAKEVRDRRPV